MPGAPGRSGDEPEAPAGVRWTPSYVLWGLRAGRPRPGAHRSRTCSMSPCSLAMRCSRHWAPTLTTRSRAGPTPSMGSCPRWRLSSTGSGTGTWATWNPYVVGGAPLGALPTTAVQPAQPALLRAADLVGAGIVEVGQFAWLLSQGWCFLRRHGLSRRRRARRHRVRLVGLHDDVDQLATHLDGSVHPGPVLDAGAPRAGAARAGRGLVAGDRLWMLLGGFPFVTLYTLVVAGAYVVVRVVSTLRRDVRAAAGVLVRAPSGVALGFGLAAVQVLPFVLWRSSTRAAWTSCPGRHLPLGLFLTTVDSGQRSPLRGWRQVRPDQPDRIGGLPRRGRDGAGTVRARAPAAGRRCAPFSAGVPRGVALLVLSVLIWLGGPLLVAIEQLPFFSSNLFTRALSVFGSLGAALAGVPPARALAGRSSGYIGSGVGPPMERGLTRSRAGRGRPPGRWPGAGPCPSHRHRQRLSRALEVLAAGACSCWRPRWRWPSYASAPRGYAPGPGGLAVLAVAQSAMFAHTMLPLSGRRTCFR